MAAHTNNVVDVIARDLGICRFSGESDASFVCRVVHTGARFWMESACLDDGCGGKEGVSKKRLISHFSAWLNTMQRYYPALDECTYDSVGKDIFECLLMSGDIVSENGGESYRSTADYRGVLPANLVAVMGMCDVPTMVYEKNMFFSGMMLCDKELRLEDSPVHYKSDRWWELPDSIYTWTSVDSLGDVQWMNPYASTWGFFDDAGWESKKSGDLPFDLVRMKNAFTQEYYLVKKCYGRYTATRIDKKRVGSLFLNIRNLSGNAIRGKYEQIDNSYMRIVAPFNLIPIEVARWINLMTWKENNSAIHRIIRNECLESITELLKESGIELAIKEQEL